LHLKKRRERKQRNDREEKEGLFLFLGDSKFPNVQILSSIFQFCFFGLKAGQRVVDLKKEGYQRIFNENKSEQMPVEM